MTQYVALLRGINVGGNNLIAMPALKRCFESQGFEEVLTWIQSGNVLFKSKERGPGLVAKIESRLSDTFGYAATVVLRSEAQLRRVVTEAPPGFGVRTGVFSYEVLFLKAPLSSSRVLPTVPFKPGVDQLFAGSGVIYFSRLIRKASQSHLNRLVALPVYKQITIRGWNTTTRLLDLMETRRAPGQAGKR
jgi:uncharacterized protein (DUF1697 family)